MSHKSSGLPCFLVFLAVSALLAPRACAQAGGTTAPLAGQVSDATGGVLPGADVIVKNNATPCRVSRRRSRCRRT